MNNSFDMLSQMVGNTPLIKLRKLSEITGCSIYGKAEFMNPGGSVKDRAAKAILEHAEQTGALKRAAPLWKALPAIQASRLACWAIQKAIKPLL